MRLIIDSGLSTDLDELSRLYDELNDYLTTHTNYPGWIKGVYPVRETAASGLRDNSLYVARYNGKIIGSIILDHQPEEAYLGVRWKITADYEQILVVRTFVVHPSFLKLGVGHALMYHALELAHNLGMKSVRLDVYEKNLSAIALYEKCGFEYIDTVDLGLGNYGLDWFKLYEKVCRNENPL